MQAEIEVRREGETRRDARSTAQQDGEVNAAGTDSLKGVVTDLSRSGFRMLVDEPLAPESVVWLKVGGYGPFMARVVWYDGAAIGCEFAGKLQPDIERALLGG
jgi:hypothetical protein